jgi:hypothetical protein
MCATVRNHGSGGVKETATRTVVEAALAFYEASNRDDRAALLALTAGDIEIISAAPQSTGASRIESGHDGLRRFWQQLDANEVRPETVVLECRELDGCALSKIAVTSRREGVPPSIATTLWTVITLNDDGKIASTWSFRHEIEARAAIRSGRVL